MNHHVMGARSVAPQTMIRQAFDRAVGNKDAAIRDLFPMVETNKSLRDYVIMKGLTAALGEVSRSDNAAIHSTVRAEINSPRSRVTDAQRTAVQAAQDRTRGLAQSNMSALFSVSLPNGVIVANATRSDLAHAVEHFSKQGADMLQKSTYYRTMLQRLPDGIKAGEHFRDEDLKSMFGAAQRGHWVDAA